MEVKPLTLSTQTDRITGCLAALGNHPASSESILAGTFADAPESIVPDARRFEAVVNAHLYRYILKCYRHNTDRLCLWRFIKNLSPEQLRHDTEKDPDLKLLDALTRIYLYSGPLDDLTCLFIPLNEHRLIPDYLRWIQSYFYHADYPTSLLWLYALDSSLASLFPDEIIFLGRRTAETEANIFTPDFTDEDTVLLKRYSEVPGHYVQLEGKVANDEFRHMYAFLKKEYQDRCLSRSGRRDEYPDHRTYDREWEKFEDVLRFGVSDRHEQGCISFSDMRSSTEFLNTYGKKIYLNKIQQPFFEQTKLISKLYNGRIDKFMGDNVMCVFLKRPRPEGDQAAVLNNFFAMFDLCRILYDLIRKQGLEGSRLGLRSGVTYGDQILRSNLGNEFVRDFTVTGETVNLAARLEHISIHELKLHNDIYFQDTIDRFPKISRLVSICDDRSSLNEETLSVIEAFTLYQNIHSNLAFLADARFDIRMNQPFYLKLKEHLQQKGFERVNPDTARRHGYDEYEVDGFRLRFYFMYYNPKGFNAFEAIRILPLTPDVLCHLDMLALR